MSLSSSGLGRLFLAIRLTPSAKKIASEVCNVCSDNSTNGVSSYVTSMTDLVTHLHDDESSSRNCCAHRERVTPKDYCEPVGQEANHTSEGVIHKMPKDHHYTPKKEKEQHTKSTTTISTRSKSGLLQLSQCSILSDHLLILFFFIKQQ